MGASTNAWKLLFLVYLMNQIYLMESQTPGQKLFRCKSGEYIKFQEFCDQAKDCADGSDEPDQCKSENCGSEQKFQCTSGPTENFTCISPKLICDTRKDCPYGSDEANCGDEVNVNNCPLSKGKFLCKDKLRCLDLEYTCDGYCNCFDCSDENENCTRRDDQLLAKCSHSYFPTPSGLRCFCNPDDGTFDSLCKEIKDCPKENPCDQRCSQYKDKMLCSCNDDYIEIMVTYGFKCRSREYYGTRVIYSTSTQIKSLNATSKEVTIIKKNVQSDLLAAARDVVYYTTLNNGGKSMFIISSGKAIEIIKSNSSITSIEIDYITGNVYFIINQTLSACSKKAETCVQLKCCEVTQVALAPKFGWMFYMRKSYIQGEEFVIKSNMDGSDENIFIDGTLRYVQSLAVDESFSRLYWFDQLDRLSSISLHDLSMKKHYLKLGAVESMRVLDEIFFFTGNRDNTIYQQENLERFVKSSKDKEKDDTLEEILIRYRYSYFEYDLKPSDKNFTIYKDTNTTISIKKIAVYNSIRQRVAQDKNPCKSVSCSGLCLLRPASATSKNNLGFTCTCDEFIPSDDDHWCIDPSLQTDPSTASRQLQGADSGNSVSFVEIFFVLILLAAVLGGVYFVYQKYFSMGMFSRRFQPRSERIYDNNQSEI